MTGRGCAAMAPSVGTKKRRVLLAAAGIAAGTLMLLSPLRRLLGQVAMAALLAWISLPLCRAAERKLSGKAAAFLSILCTLTGMAGVILLILPQVIGQLTQLAGQLPGLFATLQNAWQQISRSEWFQALHLDAQWPSVWMKEAGNYLAQEAPRVLTLVAGGVDALSRAFLSPVLGYYFLRDRAFFCYQLSLLIPSRKRKTVLKMLQQMKKEAGGYLRGQGMICLCVMALTALGLLVLGIPSFLTLGIIMGLCEFIPYIGPLIGGIPVVLFSMPLGFSKVLWAVGLVIAVQQAEGLFLSPRLMAGAVSLHPVYVLLLLTLGGLIGGLWGMMAAIPIFVCIRGAVHILYVEKQPDSLVNFSRNDTE